MIINYHIMILNIKICNISCHSHEFIVVFILCTGYIQTSVTIPYDMKRSQPDTWCSVLYATLPSIMHFARHIWMRSFQIIWNIHVCVCIYIYIYTHTLQSSHIQGAAEITPTFGGVTARAVEGVQ